MEKDVEYLDIVDDDNRVIGKERHEKVYENKLSHRIAHIFVFNSKGQLLLQKRARTKHFCPGYLCTSAGGHVKSGESYESAAKRELFEELGIRDAGLERLHEFLHVTSNGTKKFLCLFGCVWDGKTRLKRREVESARFYDLGLIRKDIGKMKITPELQQLLTWYIGRR